MANYLAVSPFQQWLSTTTQSCVAENAARTSTPSSDSQTTALNGIATSARLTTQPSRIITVRLTKTTSATISTRDLSFTPAPSTLSHLMNTWTDHQCLRRLSSCLTCHSQRSKADIYSRQHQQSKELSRKEPCPAETAHVFVFWLMTRISTFST